LNEGLELRPCTAYSNHEIHAEAVTAVALCIKIIAQQQFEYYHLRLYSAARNLVHGPPKERSSLGSKDGLMENNCRGAEESAVSNPS
jgi:hypothetical protein